MIGLCFGEENSIKNRAELPENDKPKNRDHQTRHKFPAGSISAMEQQNIDDHRSNDSECQRNGSSEEKQNTRDQLQQEKQILGSAM